MMHPATAARTVASSALGGWALSRQRRSVAAAASAALHSSAAALSPPRQQQRRGLPQPARAGARDAAMRELMSSRDDARADSLKSKAPLGKTMGIGTQLRWRRREKKNSNLFFPPLTFRAPLSSLTRAHYQNLRKQNLSILPVTKIEWLSPLSIIQYPDPRLRAVNGRVGIFDEALAQLSKEMFEVMYDSEDGGVGLAAPQVGVNLRLMVFNPGKEREKEEEVVLVNPQVLSASGPIRPFEEGCLSFPGVYGEVLVSLPFDIFASSRFFCLRASAGKPRA